MASKAPALPLRYTRRAQAHARRRTGRLEVGQRLPGRLRAGQRVDDLLHRVGRRVGRRAHQHLHLRPGRRLRQAPPRGPLHAKRGRRAGLRQALRRTGGRGTRQSRPGM